MKKLVTCILVLSILCSFSGCKQSPECSRCDRHITPIHRVINGGADFYLCTDCSVSATAFGAFYYKYKGSCYYCKNEAVCELIPAVEQDDEYTCYTLVCDTCKAYKEKYDQWPN